MKNNSSYIVTRAPMRITLGGGGTDVMWYSKLRGGAWISASINRYVYVTLSPSEDGETFRIVHPDGITEATSVSDIENPVIKACFEAAGMTEPVEVYVKSEATGRSGLGGSGAFEVALLQALFAWQKKPVSKLKLAEIAADIEIEQLKMPVGPQDQYITALGGINYFSVDQDGFVSIERLNISQKTIAELENNLLFFRTGIQRDTAAVLGDQKKKTEAGSPSREAMIGSLDDIKELGQTVRQWLIEGNVDEFGRSLHEHWLIKKRLSDKVTSTEIDEWYEAAMSAGALGGKIMGAGGGGWFMFYVNKNKDEFRSRMKQLGLVEQSVQLEDEGVTIVTQPAPQKVTSYSFTNDYYSKVAKVAATINKQDIARMMDLLVDVKKRGGRLFLLGVGGSAANCSHAVNDFRKICNIETYAPVDNVSELTARTNDEGWDVVFINWLKGSRLKKEDAIMVFSVGGGNVEKNVSPNIVKALQYAKEIGTSIMGVVSRDGGYTKQVADACVLVPVIDEENITPLAESFQAVVWHGMVNYPELRD